MSCTIHPANIGVCPITELVVVIDLCNLTVAIGASELLLWSYILKDHMVPESS